MYGLIGPDGKPGLSFLKGERFSVRLQNESEEPTLIHWHGLTPPWEQDGVPDVTQKLLSSGKSYDYNFPLTRGGTNWMHAHTLQEQQLLAAPLIVRESANSSEQEVTVLLHDFSFKTPEELLAGLQGGTSSSHQMSGGMMMDHAMMGHDMGGMDVNDITYDAYLANDRTLDDPEVTEVESGSTIRVRVINGATSTGFTVDLGGLTGQLVAVDGIDVKPVAAKKLPHNHGPAP